MQIFINEIFPGFSVDRIVLAVDFSTLESEVPVRILGIDVNVVLFTFDTFQNDRVCGYL